MRLRIIAVVVACFGAKSGIAQGRPDISNVLSLEGGVPSAAAWGAARTVSLDSSVVHAGRYAARLENATATAPTVSMTLEIPVNFRGESVELRGWVKLDSVEGRVGLWVRQNGPGTLLSIDNMANRPLRGTHDWQEVRVSVPLDWRTRRIALGALLSGKGRAWFDDFEIRINDVPLAGVPLVEPTQDGHETDHEFDAGSRFTNTSLSESETARVVLLTKVWGFLKYYHADVRSGRRHWDYEFLRMLPQVVSATSQTEGQQRLAAWVKSLGPNPPCAPCVTLEPGQPLMPSLEWLRDTARLGNELRTLLNAIYSNRPNDERQYFAGQFPGVGNPDFSAEQPYADLREPDAGYRLLSVARMWNIVEYYSPYRDLIGPSWEKTLASALGAVVRTKTREEYELAMIEFVSRIEDSHSGVWSSGNLIPPRGNAMLPVVIRYVENKPTVVRYRHEVLGPASGLLPGDVIISIGDVKLDSLFNAARHLYGASNEAATRRDFALNASRGVSGKVDVEILRGGQRMRIPSFRVRRDSVSMFSINDLPGPTFRRLSQDIAYLKLSSVRAADVAQYRRDMEGAKMLIIDIRNYPSEFVVFALGRLLVKEPTGFAKFTKVDNRNPGAFVWTPVVALQPGEPYFPGHVAILVDEQSQSQSEYTAMAFRSRPGAIVVGSTTAGADGNISAIALPGGLRTTITGLGVFYPDGRPTQRIGILPDVAAAPTLAGIVAGRDEVLEAAVRKLLGRDLTPAEQASLKKP